MTPLQYVLCGFIGGWFFGSLGMWWHLRRCQ